MSNPLLDWNPDPASVTCESAIDANNHAIERGWEFDELFLLSHLIYGDDCPLLDDGETFKLKDIFKAQQKFAKLVEDFSDEKPTYKGDGSLIVPIKYPPEGAPQRLKVRELTGKDYYLVRDAVQDGSVEATIALLTLITDYTREQLLALRIGDWTRVGQELQSFLG